VRHSYVKEGLAFRLRPLQTEDSEFVVGLRTDPTLGRFLNSTRLEDHLSWLPRHYARPDDFYFIVESRSTSEPQGAVALYDEIVGEQAEWGRWIMRRGSLAAPESALLIYRFAFEDRGLKRCYCRTVAANKSVVNFHTSSGLSNVERLKDYFGPGQDSIEQEATIATFPAIAERLEKASMQSARLLERRNR
jgi:RimJ/RimL family protein N-acetyltransferase